MDYNLLLLCKLYNKLWPYCLKLEVLVLCLIINVVYFTLCGSFGILGLLLFSNELFLNSMDFWACFCRERKLDLILPFMQFHLTKLTITRNDINSIAPLDNESFYLQCKCFRRVYWIDAAFLWFQRKQRPDDTPADAKTLVYTRRPGGILNAIAFCTQFIGDECFHDVSGRNWIIDLNM